MGDYAGDPTVDDTMNVQHPVAHLAETEEGERGGLQMKCLECGAETAEANRFCARCGAPVVKQRSMAADRGTGTPQAAPSADRETPQDAPHQPVGRRAGRRYPRRRVVIISGLGLLVLVVIVVIATARSSPRQLTFDQLRVGDCLRSSNLGLNLTHPHRRVVTAVPCAQQHIAEVFYVGNVWPQSQAFPGYYAIGVQATVRCEGAFGAYDGIPVSESAFNYGQVSPITVADWASGVRSVECIAYKPTLQYPGGAPVNYSIKGSRH